ncbi:helix-turn-helix domain-containing protein [Proteiniclasticum sp. SCR006]|uniref:Helix-turn-helix domain-containing protein n=1 Tax=Proteiniclasticum aestuarii TaxID=2817862 RepID=A0A939HB24_9CLOT|nr:helix-turn-helix domain-containing protein [Proteiniclasticum aestuarii]MBO1264746.1 helix-turn-helix domain-containing protein [Proteiniclasticum aestuarii]
MWNLIEIKEQAKYRMIEILFQASDPITIETLAKESHSSARSIKNYLVELRKMISPLNGRIETSNEGVQLHLPPHVGIDHFQRQLIRSTPEFMLLEHFFTSSSSCSSSLSEKFYISPSTLNRMLRIMKEELEEYGLTIESNPYRITGEEHLIRKFYSAYFQEAYASYEWPFSDLSESLVKNLLEIFLSFSDIDKDFMDYHRFKINLAIDLLRSRKGFTTKVSPLLESSSSEDVERAALQILASKIEVLNLTEDDSARCVQQLVWWYHRYSRNHFLMRRVHDEAFNLEVSQTERIISDLSNYFDLPAFDHTAILMDMSLFLEQCRTSNTRNIIENHLLFRPRDYFIIDIYRHNFYYFYDVLEQKLKELFSENRIPLNQTTLENLIHIFLTKWDDLTEILFDKYSTCRILIYSHINFRHGQNIANSLLKNINRSISIEVYPEPLLSERQLSDYNFDILVSSTTLSLHIPQKIQYLHYKIFGPFVQPLVQQIDKVIAENNRRTRNRVLKMMESPSK